MLYGGKVAVCSQIPDQAIAYIELHNPVNIPDQAIAYIELHNPVNI
jgi:predicted metalloenzyme YecM